MPLAPVDTAIVIRVGPAVDDTDFKSRETVAFNAAGITVGLHKSAVAGAQGTFTTAAITPEDPAGEAGNRWQHIGGGYHELEITAAQNNVEGELQVVAIATGVLHFESAVYTIVPVAVYNALVAGTDTLEADVKQILGTSLTETAGGYLAAAFKKLFDVETPVLVASDAMRGTDDANTTTPPTVGEIRTELEGAGTKLTAVHAVIPATAPPTNTQFEARTLVAADYGTAANQTTLINRIGAFTGTGLNTVLGFFRAIMKKDAALTPSDVGGTFDNTTDSVEAIRDTAPLGTAMRGTDSAALASAYTADRAAKLDNLDATISSRATPGAF